MKYRIRCRVSGGVTGTREAWLKGKDGQEARYDTREEAEREAADLNRTMNHLYSTASFRYTVCETDS